MNEQWKLTELPVFEVKSVKYQLKFDYGLSLIYLWTEFDEYFANKTDMIVSVGVIFYDLCYISLVRPEWTSVISTYITTNPCMWTSINKNLNCYQFSGRGFGKSKT